MFVSSARFVAEHKKNPAAELSILGVEKTDETGRLCRLNLAVHGLEGDIRHGGQVNSYYDDPHNATGSFDFVLANPPFNVNAVDKERLKDSVGPGRRFPFGLPRTDNANYLWIQLFYSALNEHGRAGFVMANSAADARSSEQELRKQLIEARAADVVVAVGPNMFYTVTLPVMLWFLDRGKTKSARAETVLFVDARQIYRQIDRAHREWTEAQIGFLANVVRLYRGEPADVTCGGKEASENLSQVFGNAPKYCDVPGLCKVATIKEIEARGWSLSPGDYVGVSPAEAIDDDIFRKQVGLRIRGSDDRFTCGTLSAIATALYHEWFVKFRYPGRHDSGLFSSPLGEVPREWRVALVSELAGIIDGDWIETKDQGGQDYRLVQISNVGVGEFVETENFRYITAETFSRLRCTEILPGDLLVARMPDPIGRAWLATKMPWKMITAVDVAIVRPDPKVLLPMVLAHAWNSGFNLRRIAGQASGTTRARITRRQIAMLPFLIPPLTLQRKFEAIVGPDGRVERDLGALLSGFRDSRDALLDDVFAGNID